MTSQNENSFVQKRKMVTRKSRNQSPQVKTFGPEVGSFGNERKIPPNKTRGKKLFPFKYSVVVGSNAISKAPPID